MRPLKDYLEKLVYLHELIAEDNGDCKRAEITRDEMDVFWKEMSKEQTELARNVSIALSKENKKIKDQESEATCEYCSNKGARYIPDPFSSEIHGDDTPHWICDDCEYQSAMDI
jgi:hypothetical protein